MARQGQKVRRGRCRGNWLRNRRGRCEPGAAWLLQSHQDGCRRRRGHSNSGTFPFKLFEVAPYINRVSLGCQVTGAMTVNERVWRKLPDDLKGILAQLGTEYSEVHGSMLMTIADAVQKKMTDQGATVVQMSDDARGEWAANLPDIAGEWRKFNDDKGLPATEVMGQFLDKMTAAGAKPLRDWSA